MRIQAEVDSVAEDLNVGLADHVAGGFGGAAALPRRPPGIPERRFPRARKLRDHFSRLPQPAATSPQLNPMASRLP